MKPRCPECGLPLPRDRCPVPGCRPTPAAARTYAVTRAESHREAISKATAFHVTRFIGHAKYEDLGTYERLARARAVRRTAGRDEYGRRAMIYAVCPGRASIFVE